MLIGCLPSTEKAADEEEEERKRRRGGDRHVQSVVGVVKRALSWHAVVAYTVACVVACAVALESTIYLNSHTVSFLFPFSPAPLPLFLPCSSPSPLLAAGSMGNR